MSLVRNQQKCLWDWAETGCPVCGIVNISHLKGRAQKFSHRVIFPLCVWTQTSLVPASKVERSAVQDTVDWVVWFYFSFFFLFDINFEPKKLSGLPDSYISSTLKDKRIDPWHFVFIPSPKCHSAMLQQHCCMDATHHCCNVPLYPSGMSWHQDNACLHLCSLPLLWPGLDSGGLKFCWLPMSCVKSLMLHSLLKPRLAWGWSSQGIIKNTWE